MSPEQALGNSPTPAFDIYALGVILYELLTTRVPFHGATPIETMTLIQKQEPVPPRRLQPGVAKDLETICLKCLEKNPDRRYPTAEALADDLRRYLNHRPIEARRLSEVEKLGRWCRRNPWIAASLAGVLNIFLVAFAWFRGAIGVRKPRCKKKGNNARRQSGGKQQNAGNAIGPTLLQLLPHFGFTTSAVPAGRWKMHLKSTAAGNGITSVAGSTSLCKFCTPSLAASADP